MWRKCFGESPAGITRARAPTLETAPAGMTTLVERGRNSVFRCAPSIPARDGCAGYGVATGYSPSCGLRTAVITAPVSSTKLRDETAAPAGRLQTSANGPRRVDDAFPRTA